MVGTRNPSKFPRRRPDHYRSPQLLMNLPQELLDEILSYLSSNDKQDQQSLRNHSLVAKSWVNPARRRLFRTVEIRERTLLLWLDTIPPTNKELLQHIRSLSYVTNTTAERATWRPEYRTSVLRDYLPSLHQLRHLSLSSMHISSDIAQQVDIFSAFRHTLSRLSLDYCNVTISALITLINHFPSLDWLDLNRPSYEVDGEPVSPVSRPLIRKLHISDVRGSGFDLLDELSGLGPVFDEIVVGGWLQGYSHVLGLILGAVGVKAKRLRLLRDIRTYRPAFGSVLLSRCRELRELEIAMAYPGTKEVDLISSITSTNIRKITFTYPPSVQGFSWYDVYWRAFDNPLSLLVGRLGCKRRLEVEFRILDVEIVEMDGEAGAMVIVNSLAEFREKGQIRVVLIGLDGSACVVYPPPR
ncbi:hypothetical protein BDM02DRAFT_2735437 [Thelephora ganbajun]|uniref:Uncharacterized protein n=1 Tax=Thelephora ganbajun TaxID=370292 RepID=A0ACB6ZCJ6_THEGA|nr:hypothetical protein BDM02DRAFT_2735437 [Thelephora ganbajun]